MKKLVLFLIFGILLVNQIVYAQSNTSDDINSALEEVKEELNKTIGENRKKVKEMMEEAEEEAKIIIEEKMNETQETLEELKKLLCSEIKNARRCAIRRDCMNVFEWSGGKKIWKNCTIKPIYRAIKARERIRGLLAIYKNMSECPEDCTCTGSVTKCEIGEGRIMTVVAGKSGNIIIQTKSVNASTSVVLIKNKTGVFGNFSGKMKRLRYMPDQVREKILKKLRMKKCNCTTELLENGNYEMEIERKYRILGIFPRKKVVVCVVDAETGEIIRMVRPWWRFLAWKSKE